MDSAVSRIVKAKQYAAERNKRVKIDKFEVEFHGDNSNHLVEYDQATWTCDCDDFRMQGICAHIMALETILGDSVEPALMSGHNGGIMDGEANRVMKAKQYALERDRRLKFHSFMVQLHGDSKNHAVAYNRGEWTCDCEEFLMRGVCAHIMAIEEILGESVEPALYATAH